MGRSAKEVKMDECLKILDEDFKNFKDIRTFTTISLRDFLVSSFAVFSLKYPSLLNFEKEMQECEKKKNLKSLFKLENIPSDTHLRDVMDKVETNEFRRAFKKLFSFCQRNKLLERYEFRRVRSLPYYLLSVDGTGYYHSNKVGCSSCNQYKGSEERKLKRFGHHVLGGSLVHPERKEVLPVFPEPIIAQDGDNKNDCELNAFKRFIVSLRREHPKLNLILNLDALYASAPAINLLFEHEYSFITVIKETNRNVFRQVEEGEKSKETGHYEYSYEIGDKIKKQVIHKYRYRKNVHLNQDPRSVRVNFVEFWEEINWVNKDGINKVKRVHFAWVTDLDVKKESLIKIMKGGRARWKIENETFNTLKNQGYNFEHNYGHGKSNLSVNFIVMMFLAFFVDQIQQASCQAFKKALEKVGSKRALWKKMSSWFEMFELEKWGHMFMAISGELKIEGKLVFNTS